MSDAFPTLVPFIRYTSFSLFKLFGKKKTREKTVYGIERTCTYTFTFNIFYRKSK